MALTGNELKNIGFTESKALGLALQIINKNYAGLTDDEKLTVLKDVLSNPEAFSDDEKLAPLAAEMLRPIDDIIALSVDGKSYQIYGADAIEQDALDQMGTAMKLPVT